MTTISPRETLDRALQELLDEIIVMGSMVEEAVIASVDALKRRDFEASKQIYAADLQINEKHFAIENAGLIVIATQQPMARDLRLLAAVLEAATELERMGDYAKGISRINLLLGDQPLVKPLIDIPRMAEISADMLHRALGAFVAGDVETARAIPKEDEVVDDLYNQVYRELITYMIADPTTIDRANYLLWVAHNLERMADRVTNICERTIFVATGEMSEMDRSDDELSPE
ncbi:MAG: phosphate transport system regulatory protein PhoU [Chloroflexi bacterium RBG_19FT_COMBO_55_16]|nr:MAG: phosphate transport system regulatory protein PhoU [Chloroflexi bacterium RBG_19FT_COMBO_55_16]